LEAIRESVRGSEFENDLWVVGGAVRDELLGMTHEADFDLVTRGDSAKLARLLHEAGVSAIPPVTYERFGTAMVRVSDANIEIVTARRESYDPASRKPTVEPASYDEDAARRDFTVNTLMRSLHSGELRDPLGSGLADIKARLLRTPLDPIETFRDDPLRMLRAVRFRGKLGFTAAPELYSAIRAERERLRIVSPERIRDEILKILALPAAPDCLDEMMQLGLFEIIAPEFLPMVDCEQGRFHHLDVWHHSLFVLRNVGPGDPIVSLAALLHDVGKPPTRFIDEAGNTRFFGHESVGAEMSRALLRRWKFSEHDVDAVVRLVRAHMRLGTAPEFTPAAARRLLRDLGDDLPKLLQLVEADANALRPGVRALDLLPIRERIAEVSRATPRASLDSPLTGEEIMAAAGLPPGPEIGRLKKMLTDLVLEGDLAPGDKVAALSFVLSLDPANQGS
jgi:poly(A) polymerase